MKLKQALLIAAATLLIISTASVAYAFDDTAGHWAEAEIDRWSGLGIIIGSDGLFRPDSCITRGEMATIIDRIMLYTERAENTFSDLAGAWSADSVLKANAAGVMKGDGVRMRPNDLIMFEEAAVMVCRALGIAETSGDGSMCSDWDSVSSWSRGFILTLINNDYTTPANGKIDPKHLITRAELVKLLDNIIKGIYTGNQEYRADCDGTAVFAAGNYIYSSFIDGDLIISPSITGELIIDDVEITGRVINLSSAKITLGGFTECEVVEMKNAQPEMPIIPVTHVGDYIDYFGKLIPIDPAVPVSSFDYNSFSTDEKGYISYKDATFGVDISAWQEAVDWSKVRDSGVEFAMLRIGYRGYTVGSLNEDKYFRANIEGALENGIRVGVYFYSQAITPEEAIDEASFVLDIIGDYDITYPVCFDWEFVSDESARTKGISGDTVTDCAIAFCETIADAGYIPAVYIYTETALLCYDMSRICEYDLWFAKYNRVPDFYYDFQMWQYTSSGSMPGVPGKCDLNLCFKKY